ncbi:hypothetical protein GCM10029992_32750 [Glycomyces albus]
MLRADSGRPVRADGSLALHVLEVMTAVLESAAAGKRLAMTTSVERPSLVPLTDRGAWTG